MIYPLLFADEEYVYITQNMVPDIDINRYMISNYGVVRDTWRDRDVALTVANGYIRVCLHKQNGGAVGVLAHRLVAMAFIPGNWSLQVNHKDGIKFNNYYMNLEWTTARENLMHALDLGLNHRGENKPNSILTNDQVHQICIYLENGYDYNYIINIMNLSEIPNIDDMLHCIKCKKSWRFISDGYNLPTHRIVNNRFLSNDQVEIICRVLLENPSVSNKDLFDMVGLDVSTPDKYNKARHCIESIKSKKAYRDISNKYLV